MNIDKPNDNPLEAQAQLQSILHRAGYYGIARLLMYVALSAFCYFGLQQVYGAYDLTVSFERWQVFLTVGQLLSALVLLGLIFDAILRWQAYRRITEEVGSLSLHTSDTGRNWLLNQVFMIFYPSEGKPESYWENSRNPSYVSTITFVVTVLLVVGVEAVATSILGWKGWESLKLFPLLIAIGAVALYAVIQSSSPQGSVGQEFWMGLSRLSKECQKSRAKSEYAPIKVAPLFLRSRGLLAWGLAIGLTAGLLFINLGLLNCQTEDKALSQFVQVIQTKAPVAEQASEVSRLSKQNKPWWSLGVKLYPLETPRNYHGFNSSYCIAAVPQAGPSNLGNFGLEVCSQSMDKRSADIIKNWAAQLDAAQLKTFLAQP
jgi:hypothetical protein